MVSSHFHKNYKKNNKKKHAYLFFLVSVFTLLGYGSVNWLLGALENKQKQKTKKHIQCPPLILAPLINVRKGVCENKSALFILLIFHSKNSQNSNLSLK